MPHGMFFFFFSIRHHVKNLCHIQGRHKAGPWREQACELLICLLLWILTHRQCTCEVFPPCGCVCVSAALKKELNRRENLHQECCHCTSPLLFVLYCRFGFPPHILHPVSPYLLPPQVVRGFQTFVCWIFHHLRWSLAVMELVIMRSHCCEGDNRN